MFPVVAIIVEIQKGGFRISRGFLRALPAREGLVRIQQLGSSRLDASAVAFELQRWNGIKSEQEVKSSANRTYRTPGFILFLFNDLRRKSMTIQALKGIAAWMWPLLNLARC